MALKIRHLLLLLILPCVVYGQQATTFIVLPYGISSPGFFTNGNFLTSNQMTCGRLAIPIGINNATKIGISMGPTTATKCSATVYQDSNTGGIIITTGSLACNTGGPPTANDKRVTGLGPVTLVAGASYRICACANGGGAYVGTVDTNRAPIELLNAFHAIVGVAANACDSDAVPPATTGVITPSEDHSIPRIYLWAE